MNTCRVADIFKTFLQNKYAPETYSDTKGNTFCELIITKHTFSYKCLMLGVLTMVVNTMTFIAIALKLQD